MSDLASSTCFAVPHNEQESEAAFPKHELSDQLIILIDKAETGIRINATVRGGDATVTGMIKNEYERRPIVRCVAAVQGIRRVVDRLKVAKKMNPNGQTI